ncbi:hypothetical protein ACFXKW_32105 [Streptomyces sp. NPDC059193]|uniref:hypothetical protein n=1 Tax=Streptomyces sp. NPDC059193 TaxID=3346763 RepID=UPI0036A80A06
MSHEVIWEQEALAQAERSGKDDPDGVRQVFAAVDHLADDPRPKGAFGNADVLHIHVGAYRDLRDQRPADPRQRHSPRTPALRAGCCRVGRRRQPRL